MADTQTGFLYLGDYKPEEEAFLRAADVRVFRADAWPDMKSLPATDGAVTELLVRGARLASPKYEFLWRIARSAGVSLVTSPEAFRTLGNPELQYRALSAVSPATLFVDAHVEDFEVTNVILRNKIEFPVFIRSDLESAAKYVGLEGCVAAERDAAALRTVLSNLRRHVRGMSKIIAKQVVLIAKGENGRPLEYRAIGARGRFSHFDLAGSGLPPDPRHGLEEFAGGAFRLLAEAGADGAAFVDVAVKEGGGGVVVECKDMLNGSIANLDLLAEAVKARRI